MNKAFGILIVVLALVIGIVPQFTDCKSQGKVLTLQNGKTVDMKCHWTARAEIAVAVPMFLVGAVMVGGKRKETWQVTGLMASTLGVLAIALPTQLIGVCSSAMPCNLVMRPALLLTGGIVVVAGALAFVTSGKRADDIS